jgi:hypothetical protein
MVRRLIGLWCAGALLAGCGGASHSLPSVGATAGAAPTAAKTVAVSFSIAVPMRSQSLQNRRLQYVSSATKSATFGVAAGSATPQPAGTVTVNCTTVCSGTVLAPIGSDTFVAKLFGAVSGGGELLSTGSVKQTIAAATNTVHLTFNPVVASVALSLDKPGLPSGAPGTAQLNVMAKDPSGAIIVGPGSYVDASGQALKVTIASPPLANTQISPTPTEFSAPQTAAGVSNIATISFTPPGHFQFPTFTVANPGLPSDPPGGVTLLYEPLADDDAAEISGASPPSVGGNYIPGDGGTEGDILRISPSAAFSLNNCDRDRNGVTLGYGSDKQIYFACAPSAAPVPNTVVFGRFDEAGASPISPPENFSSLAGLGEPLYGNGLTLGNDGSLWFSGTDSGVGIVGKIPPAGSSAPTPLRFTVAGSTEILKIGPGLGNNEVLLYRAAADSTIHIATLPSDLSGLTNPRQITNQTPFGSVDVPNLTLGDLLTAADGSVYVSAATFASQGNRSSVYRISATDGSFSLLTDCQNISGKVFRLPDGTGVGTSTPVPGGPLVYIHVVPAKGCTLVPDASGKSAQFFESIDATTDNWYYFHNPNGHRRGIF